MLLHVLRIAETGGAEEGREGMREGVKDAGRDGECGFSTSWLTFKTCIYSQRPTLRNADIKKVKIKFGSGKYL